MQARPIDETAVLQRAMKWMTGDDTGISSMALCAFMVSGEICRKHDYPRDPGDFGRCARLLLLVPEWCSRVPEMTACGPYWAALAARWAEITTSMESECGLKCEKSRTAPDTYKLMRSVLEPVEKADKSMFRFGGGSFVFE